MMDLGGMEASAVALEVERLGRDGTLQEAGTAVDRLEQSINELFDALDTWVREAE